MALERYHGTVVVSLHHVLALVCIINGCQGEQALRSSSSQRLTVSTDRSQAAAYHWPATSHTLANHCKPLQHRLFAATYLQ